jgi:hypothetical protein
MGLLGFLRRPHERAGFELYAAAVAAARAPYYFEVLAVPDTLDGRFDLVGLFAALLIRRLRLEQGAGIWPRRYSMRCSRIWTSTCASWAWGIFR